MRLPSNGSSCLENVELDGASTRHGPIEAKATGLWSLMALVAYRCIVDCCYPGPSGRGTRER